MRCVCYILVLVLSAIPSNSRAQSETNTIQEPYTQCKEDPPGFYFGVCLGYLKGVSNAMALVGSLGAKGRDGNRIGLCDAPAITMGAERQIFINWAEKYPQLWAERDVFGVYAAFIEQWPCE